MRCFTALGPAHSGKTTLVRELARLEDARPQTVDLRDLSLTRFAYLDESWCAFDAPGGADMLGHAGQALAASDAAVVVAPADPAAAVLVSPYLRLVEASGTPAVLFVNRMDAAQGRVSEIVEALQSYSSHPLVLRQIPIRESGEVVGAVDLISERAWQYREGKPSKLIEIPGKTAEREQEARADLLEHLADHDDRLLEQLIEDKSPPTEEVYALASKVLQETAMIPVLIGAASRSNGMRRLMKTLRHEAPDASAARARLGSDSIAVGMHADIRKHAGKTVMLRALAKGVAAGSGLGGDDIGALVDMDGKTPVPALAPGEVGAALKSDHLNPGHVYDGAGGARALPAWSAGPKPAFRRVVSPAAERDEARLSAALARLAEIDPGLALDQDPATGRASVALQGPMHLRRLTERLERDFGIEAADREVATEYRETISRQTSRRYRHRKQSGGAGQFAEVEIVVAPLARGEGFRFSESVKGGAVPRNYIPAVEAGATDALEAGPLGLPAIDLSVELTDGKSHPVDSSDLAFRAAGRMAVKEALAEAGPVLLQPIHSVAIQVPTVFSGELVTLTSSLKGQVLGFDGEAGAAGWDVFRALLPAARLDELFRALGGATQGTASFEAAFERYVELRGKEAEAVAEEFAQAR